MPSHADNSAIGGLETSTASKGKRYASRGGGGPPQRAAGGSGPPQRGAGGADLRAGLEGRTSATARLKGAEQAELRFQEIKMGRHIEPGVAGPFCRLRGAARPDASPAGSNDRQRQDAPDLRARERPVALRWNCWETPPEGFEKVVARVARRDVSDPESIRAAAPATPAARPAPRAPRRSLSDGPPASGGDVAGLIPASPQPGLRARPRRWHARRRRHRSRGRSTVDERRAQSPTLPKVPRPTINDQEFGQVMGGLDPPGVSTRRRPPPRRAELNPPRRVLLWKPLAKGPWK